MSKKLMFFTLLRYFGTSSAMSLAVAGAISEGFITTLFPAAIAPTTGNKVNCNG